LSKLNFTRTRRLHARKHRCKMTPVKKQRIEGWGKTQKAFRGIKDGTRLRSKSVKVRALKL